MLIFQIIFPGAHFGTKSDKPNTIVVDTHHQNSLEISKMKEHIHEKRKPRKRHKQLFTLNPSILNETPFQSVLFDSVKKEDMSDQISDQMTDQMPDQMSDQVPDQTSDQMSDQMADQVADQTADQSDLSSGPDELNEVREERPQKVKKSLECTFCKVHFQRFSLLRQHIVSVHGKKPHKCEKCEYSFAKMYDLKHHTTTVHEGKKPHKCCYCESSFSSNYGLKRHTTTVHEKQKPFKCDDCEFSFADKSKLENHIQVVHYGNRVVKFSKEVYKI